MMARIGMLRALNRGYVREFDSSRKDTHWGKQKLKKKPAGVTPSAFPCDCRPGVTSGSAAFLRNRATIWLTIDYSHNANTNHLVPAFANSSSPRSLFPELDWSRQRGHGAAPAHTTA